MLHRQKLYKNPDAFLYQEDFFAYVAELQQRSALRELPQNLYVYYVLHTLLAEVYNGGFAQFLANSSRLVLRDLLPCAELLDVPAFTALVRDFTAAVDALPEAQRADLAQAEFDDAFNAQLERLDERFNALDEDSLQKKLLQYYKAHFTVTSVTYEAVREQPGQGCSYFTLERQDRTLPELANQLFAFLEEFDTAWRLVFHEDYLFSAIPERECFDLDDLVAHFADAGYSFRTHAVGTERHARTALAALGCLYMNARNPQDPARPDYCSMDRIRIAPSGFAPGEYKIKRGFEMGWFRGSTRNAAVCLSIRAEQHGVPLACCGELRQAVLDQVRAHPCVLSVSEETFVIQGARTVTEALYRRDGAVPC